MSSRCGVGCVVKGPIKKHCNERLHGFWWPPNENIQTSQDHLMLWVEMLKILKSCGHMWPLWVLVSWKLNLAHCVCNDTTVRLVLIMLYWDAALFITWTWRLSQTFAGTSNFPLVGFYGKAPYIWWILMLKPWCPADVLSKTNPLTKQKSYYTSVILPIFDGLKSVTSFEILYILFDSPTACLHEVPVFLACRCQRLAVRLVH